MLPKNRKIQKKLNKKGVKLVINEYKYTKWKGVGAANQRQEQSTKN